MCNRLGGPRGPISEISLGPLKCQEGGRKQFNPTKAKRVRPGKTLAKGSVAHYNDKCLEPSADELVAIWLKLGFYPSVYKGVAKGITSANSKEGEGPIRAHLRRYWMAESASTTKCVLNALKKFPLSQKGRGEPLYEWDSDSVLNSPEHRRSALAGDAKRRADFLNRMDLFRGRK